MTNGSQKIEILTFEGTTVDPWLAGLKFEATIPPEGKGIVVRAIGPNAAEFQKYDTAFWLEWCRRYAYKVWAKKQPRRVIGKVTKKGKKMDLVQVDPSVPTDLTQAFKLVPEKKSPARRKRKTT